MSSECFLDVCCDSCSSNFQSNSYQGVIVREHLRHTFNICKVENIKISLRTDERDPCASFASLRLPER